jgi:hypothetical protein
MIDWLERCKDNGWKLVSDESSLLTVIEHKIQSTRQASLGQKNTEAGNLCDVDNQFRLR